MVSCLVVYSDFVHKIIYALVATTVHLQREPTLNKTPQDTFRMDSAATSREMN